jgi:class 3 adenylate cyclase/tetratricopeptide (TPR) repeat protein
MQCARCGTSLLALRAEHKLVTVLFADLVEHTATQAHVGGEVWWQFLHSYFGEMSDPIRRYGGTVEKFIGDAIFAVFGVPQSHEDDVERAVRAAVEMLATLPRLNQAIQKRIHAHDGQETEKAAQVQLRIGISTGEGVVPRTVDRDHLVVGELTSLAERLQSQLPPNSIALSERTYELVAPLVEVDSLGALTLKGFSQPQHAYALRGIRAGVAKMRGTGMGVPLVDRDTERMQLERVRGRFLEAKQGHTVMLIGEAGLGKSRLVAEMLKEVRPHAVILEARCHEFTRETAYGILIQHLRSYLLLNENDSPDVQRGQVSIALQRLFQNAKPQLQAVIDHLLGLGDPMEFEDQTRGLDSEEVRRQVIHHVAEFWRAVAEQGPLVLIIEDLHWVDAASAAVVEELARLTDAVPILLLCAFRPERQSPAWELKFKAERDRPHRYVEIVLNPLSPHHTKELAQSLLDQVGLTAQDLTQRVVAHSEGNPFYVEEMVRALSRPGVSTTTARLPDSLQGILQARLDALTEPTRRVLQTAAVIGRTFSLRMLQTMWGAETDLGPHLSELQRGEFILEYEFLPELQFAFKHILLQEAAYRSLLSEHRRILHRRLAEVLSEEAPGANLPVVFHHFIEAEAWEQAADYGARAAAWTRDAGAPEEALAHYEQVAGVLETRPSVATREAQRQLREAFGDLLVFTGQFEEARTQYYSFATLADTLPQRAHAERKIAEAHWRGGRLERAIEHLRHGLSMLPTDADPEEEAWLHLDLGYVEDLTGVDARSVLARCEKAKELARGRDDMLNARVFRLFTIAYAHLGDMNAALDNAKKAVEFSSRAGDQLELAVAHNNLADIYRHKGETDFALEHVKLGLEAAGRSEQRKAIYHIALLQLTMGELYLVQGEWGEAQDILEKGLRGMNEAGPRPRLHLELLAALAEALSEQGQTSEALQVLDEAQKLCDIYPLHRFVPTLLRVRAEAYVRAGEVDRAKDIIVSGLEAVDRYGSADERPALLRVSAMVATQRGDTDTALQMLSEAAASLEARGQLPELGRAYREMGKAWRARQNNAEAANAFQRARAIFVRLGAQRLVEEVEPLLDEAR